MKKGMQIRLALLPFIAEQPKVGADVEGGCGFCIRLVSSTLHQDILESRSTAVGSLSPSHGQNLAGL